MKGERLAKGAQHSAAATHSAVKMMENLREYEARGAARAQAQAQAQAQGALSPARFAVDAGQAGGLAGGASRASPTLGYYVPQHALKLEEPPPAHAHAPHATHATHATHALSHGAHAHVHSHAHALYEEAEYRRGEPDRPTVVSLGS